ncbi:MAG: DUF3854 domain-containing protein [Acidobacteria bacterium]|nr:DUF3854 domain-containing protein [Acidobacteriota bacterium]
MKSKSKNLSSRNAQDSKNALDQRLKKGSGFFSHNKIPSYEKNDIKYVSRKQPCEICGKPDWCSYTVNGFGEMVLALCQRVSYGSIKQAKDNSYIHVLAETKRVSNYVKAAPKLMNPKADVTRCNEVYTALLENIQVSNETQEDTELSALYSYHAERLLARGLGVDTIARNLYASVPEQAGGNELAQELSKRFDLTGVPGFYKHSNGIWQLNTYHKGYYVPYRNPKGKIIGLQIRLDKPIGKTKYVWLSTAEKDSGASSGSPLHFVNVNLIHESKEVYITEGALKADVIGELSKVGVVAMAGVKNVKAEILVETLKLLFPNLKRVFIAFDMDFQTNENVEKALSEMETGFQKWNGLEVKTLVWNLSDGKGFDDYLLQAGENENGI